MSNQHQSQFVHRLFSTIASHYDFMNSLLSLNQDNYWRNCLLEKLPLTCSHTVLDVCCGTGKLTAKIASRLGPQGKVVGLDFCQPMLDQAAALLSSHPNREAVELMCGDALALPFADHTFDHVVTAFGLRNLPNVQQPLAEMYRVVRPGGTVLSVELAKPSLPLLKQLYFFYFHHLTPLLGKLKMGRDGFYSWLPESLKAYPDQAEVAEYFKQTGFKQVAFYELTGGITAIHRGIK